MNKVLLAAMFTMAVAVSQASPVYAQDIRNGRFTTFDTLTPGTQTDIVASGYTPTRFAIDFNADASTLYGIDHTALTLDTISLVDGTKTSTVGITGITSGVSYTGLTIDTNNNFFVSTFLTGTGSQLWSLDSSTGVGTLIGLMDAANIHIDISVDSTGRMVSHDISTDSFWDVNSGTGATTLIGSHGLAANFAQGMDFDWSNDVLYAAVYTGGGTLTYGSVDLTTGAVTSIPGILSGEYEMAIQQGVPEPASMIALGAGLAALAARRRRK